MSALLRSLRDGFGALARNPGLVALVWVTNLGAALLLAMPLGILIEQDLAHTGASSGMMYAFDYDWWARWDAQAKGPAQLFGPEILGAGGVLRNVDFLLRGQVGGGLFRRGAGPGAAILGLGLLYLLLQVFLTGGLLGVFRAPRGGWTFGGFFHGCGFYLARLLRVTVVGLVLAGILFALDAPFARWVDGLAREAVSERTALALTLGARASLLLALLLVHMVASYAKVILVTHERRSARLAFVSSLGFCARHPLAALAQYAAVLGTGLGILVLLSLADARLSVVGWKTQMVALALFQAWMVARIALRLGLLATQLEWHRAQGR